MAKTISIFVWILSSLVTLVPLVVIALLPRRKTNPDNPFHARDLFSGVFGPIHSLYVTPVVTCLALIAWIPQAFVTAECPFGSSLSVNGLFVQAVVFTFVGISWMFRLKLPSEAGGMRGWWYLYTWHNMVGWAAVYNLIFAFGQAMILATAWYTGCPTLEHQSTTTRSA